MSPAVQSVAGKPAADLIRHRVEDHVELLHVFGDFVVVNRTVRCEDRLDLAPRQEVEPIGKRKEAVRRQPPRL